MLVFHHKEELQLLQRQLEEREAELSQLQEETRARVEAHGRAEGGDRGECSIREDFDSIRPPCRGHVKVVR